MEQSKSSTPRNVAPLHSLFLSLTRPLPKEIAENYIPYLILFQHSNHLLQRLTAAEPDRTSLVYKNAGLQTPKEMSSKDARGDLFILEAFKECVERCRGRIIYAKCCDSLEWNGDRNVSRLFEENGAMIDLYSDPLGWDSESKDDESDTSSVKVFKGQLSKLKSIVSAVEQAAQYIHDSSEESFQKQPIPIIFDSATPIVIHHGVQKLMLLLTHLKQIYMGAEPIVSPIIMPTLSEMISPPSLRMLEDTSDAVLTLIGGELSITKRSGRTGGMISSGFSGGLRLIKDVQHFDIESKETRGVSYSELNLHKKVDPGTKSDKKKEATRKLDVEDMIDATEKLEIDGTKGENKLAKSSSCNKDKSRPLLKHEDEDSMVKKVSVQPESKKPAPRIFMDDDDPEFDDLDEEDPDDDLDI